MTSSAADRFLGGGGGGEQQLLHQPQMCYHVAQHSRREKLRFPPEDPNSFLLLHDSNSAPQLCAADSLTAAFVPSSSSASTSTYYPHNPALNCGVLPIPAQQPCHQISNQGCSLSLSSSSSLRLPASRHHIASRPAPLGPFTGYAAVLNRSRFLGPARKLLEEACHVGQKAAGGGSGGGGQELLLGSDPPGESLVITGWPALAWTTTARSLAWISNGRSPGLSPCSTRYSEDTNNTIIGCELLLHHSNVLRD